MPDGCEATVAHGYDSYACSRHATGESLGVRLCTQHRKLAERHRAFWPGNHPYYMPQPRVAEVVPLNEEAS